MSHVSYKISLLLVKHHPNSNELAPGSGETHTPTLPNSSSGNYPNITLILVKLSRKAVSGPDENHALVLVKTLVQENRCPNSGKNNYPISGEAASVNGEKHFLILVKLCLWRGGKSISI